MLDGTKHAVFEKRAGARFQCSVVLKEFMMKSCFAAFVLSFVSLVSMAVGGEVAQSVLQQPTLAAPPAEAPAATTAVVVMAEPTVVCATGRCQRLYDMETESSESCRNRLFGGKVVRKTSRIVYRPARR